MNRRNIIKVGIPVSLTGQFQVQGKHALAGLQAWANDVNKSGGILLSHGSTGLIVDLVIMKRLMAVLDLRVVVLESV